MGGLFIFIGLMIFGAHAFSLLFSKWRVPDVLFLLAIGVCVGPIFHWVSPQELEEIGSIFASLTLLFILFDSGVDMSINDIRHNVGAMMRVMLSSLVLTAVVVACVARLLCLPWNSAFLLGTILSGTAAAIVIPIVRQIDVSVRVRTVLSLESAISAVICIVLSWAIIEGFKIGSISPFRMVTSVALSFILSIGLGLLGGMLWGLFLDRKRQVKHTAFLTPALMFIIYGLVETMGYNGSIAALAFGVVLGNPLFFSFSFLRRLRSKMGMSPYTRPLQVDDKTFYKEIIFILKTFFFVYIGVCIPFDSVDILLYGLIITVAIFVARMVLAFVGGARYSPNDRAVVAFMAPKGLASAVVASMPEQVNQLLGYEAIPGATQIKGITYSVIFCSMIVTSLLVFLWFKRKNPQMSLTVKKIK